MKARDNGPGFSVAESPESEDGSLRRPQTGHGVIADISPGTALLAGDGAGLILSRAGAGKVALHWHVEPQGLEVVRDAFPAGADPVPVIRLIGLTGPGQGATIARAPLSDGALSSDGSISVDLPDDGVRVQAELGFEASGGGWLMVVRSSSVTLFGGEASQRTEAAVSELDSARVDPALAAGGVDLKPVFPEVDLGAVLQRAVSGGLTASFSDSDSDSAADAEHEARFSLAATARSASDTVLPSRQPNDVVGVDQVRVDQGPDHGQQTGITPEGAPRPVSVPDDAAQYPERRRGSSYGNAEPRYGLGEDGGLVVYAELLVHGSAKPGSEIDLFGHRIPIGSGGRFSLHLPVPNSELLKQALDLGLPLVSRGRIEP